jgi:hypothetical protein
MKNLILFMILGIFLVSGVSAEIFLWNEVTTTESQNITRLHAFYKLEDTSEGFKWRNRKVPVTFDYSTQNLPFALTYGVVDWCNLSIIHYENDYDSEGNYLNTTTSIQSYYFSAGINTGSVTIDMIDGDEVSADMVCHYTDTRSLYQDNILAGRFNTKVPSYECKGCEDFTLEELSDEIERSDEITESELKIYDVIGTIIDLNYRLWLIASWIIKLFMLVFAVGLLFGGVYYLYKFLEDIARKI